MSLFDHPETLPSPPAWRCPYCRTLQPETARCRTCSRSTISCATCVRFRSSVASDVGYCADDRGRAPLSGEEVRECWSDPGLGAEPPDGETLGLFAEPVMPLAGPGPRPPAGPGPRPPAGPGPRPPAGPGPRPPAESASPPPLPADPDGLVEAPLVEPGRRLVSELQRRARIDHSG